MRLPAAPLAFPDVGTDASAATMRTMPGEAPSEGSARQQLLRPKVVVPALLVIVLLGIALSVNPGGKPAGAAMRTPTVAPAARTATTTPVPTATRPAQAASSPTPATKLSQSPAAGETVTNDVAGARATPAATTLPDYSRETTQCGASQESVLALSVEQAVSSVSVRATRAAVYPAEYFRCMLMATGGRESVALAASIAKAQDAGATHAVLLDLWITNSGRVLGQINLRSATVAAAGRTFTPLATLGGRSEVVVASGQGRNVTLVVTIQTNVGVSTGPMTLGIDAPISGGQPAAGKYQLFLPTP